MSLDDEILAQGKKVRALAHEGALKARKSKLVEEIKKIEEDLAGLFKHESEPTPEPEPVKESAPPPAPAPEAEKPADSGKKQETKKSA